MRTQRGRQGHPVDHQIGGLVSLTWLFDTTHFTPRKICVSVDPLFQMLAMGADILFAAAYFAIPVMLWFAYKHKPQLFPNVSAFAGFVAFISLCGATHAVAAILWEVPIYRFWILIEMMGAAASVGTAVMLPVVWHKQIKKFRTSKEYHDMADIANQERLRAEVLRSRAERRTKTLEAELAIFKTEIRSLQWSDRTKDKAAILLSQLERVIAANDAGVA